MFASGWGGSTQSEREIMCRGRKWSGPWTTIEEDRLLLPGGTLLDRCTWAAALAINIRHVVADREGISGMSPEDSGFGLVADVIDGSGTGDVYHTGSAPLVRPRDWNGFGGGLCSIN